MSILILVQIFHQLTFNRFPERCKFVFLKKQLATAMRLSRGQMTIVFSRVVNKFTSVSSCWSGIGTWKFVVVVADRTSLPVTSIYNSIWDVASVFPVKNLFIVDDNNVELAEYLGCIGHVATRVSRNIRQSSSAKSTILKIWCINFFREPRKVAASFHTNDRIHHPNVNLTTPLRPRPSNDLNLIFQETRNADSFFCTNLPPGYIQ